LYYFVIAGEGFAAFITKLVVDSVLSSIESIKQQGYPKGMIAQIFIDATPLIKILNLFVI
jgi:hypothetical protein